MNAIVTVVGSIVIGLMSFLAGFALINILGESNLIMWVAGWIGGVTVVALSRE